MQFKLKFPNIKLFLNKNKIYKKVLFIWVALPNLNHNQ